MEHVCATVGLLCLIPINFRFVRYIFGHETQKSRKRAGVRRKERSSFPTNRAKHHGVIMERRLLKVRNTIGLRDRSHREGVPLSILRLRFAGRREKGKVANRVFALSRNPRDPTREKSPPTFLILLSLQPPSTL